MIRRPLEQVTLWWLTDNQNVEKSERVGQAADHEASVGHFEERKSVAVGLAARVGQ
jgi:hypothetical protein